MIQKYNPPVLPFSSEQINELLDFSKNKLTEMRDSLYNGDIAVDPLINKKINACKYCEFSDICGNNPVLKSHDGENTPTSDTIEKIFGIQDDKNKKE